jgi:hypothetical protein
MKSALKVHIKGSEWTVRLMTDKSYDKVHDEESTAMTTDKRTLDFRKKSINLHIIRHEVLHAFVFECNTEDSNLTSDQKEELCANLIGGHKLDMERVVEQIADFALGKL